MNRNEFTAKTKRAAWDRCQGCCEGSGQRYGLKPGVQCGEDLTIKGVIYDHDDPDANSKNNSLENCRCICPACNKFKTGKIDIPKIAKTVRQQNKSRSIIRRKSRPMPGTRASGIRKRMSGQVEKWS